MHTFSHPLQICWNMLLAGVQADVLKTALALGVFDVLGEQELTAREISTATRCEAARLGHVLELLVSMQLLVRSAERKGAASVFVYGNTHTSLTYLCKGAALYCADAWMFRRETLRQLGSELEQLLARKNGASGVSVDACCHPSAGPQWALAAREQINQEQAAVTAPMAMRICESIVSLTEVRCFADFGGNAGHVAIAMARKYPSARGEVIDLAEPAEIARRNMERAGLGDRIHVRLAKPDGAGLPENRYDLLWCSSVLHFVPDIENTLREIHASLVPGGLLISAHAEIPDDPLAALSIRSYYLPLLLRNRHVGMKGALARQLQRAGFELLHSAWCPGFSVTPLQVHVARKSA